MPNIGVLRRSEESEGTSPKTTIWAREWIDCGMMSISKIAPAPRTLMSPALARVRAKEHGKPAFPRLRIETLSNSSDAEIRDRDSLRSHRINAH
jgi:hypothetical protein